MLFVMICRDKPDHLKVRMDTRPDHVEYLKGIDAEGQLKAGGPMLDKNEKPCGSMLIIDVADQVEAEAVAANDPYTKAGLFQSVEINQYTWIFNNPDA